MLHNPFPEGNGFLISHAQSLVSCLRQIVIKLDLGLKDGLFLELLSHEFDLIDPFFLLFGAV